MQEKNRKVSEEKISAAKTDMATNTTAARGWGEGVQDSLSCLMRPGGKSPLLQVTWWVLARQAHHAFRGC